MITSVITSHTNEKLICAHIHFLKEYHNSFFDINVQWINHVDKVAKKNCYLSQHMAINSGHTFKIDIDSK